jgi:hypothetical protein
LNTTMTNSGSDLGVGFRREVYWAFYVTREFKRFASEYLNMPMEKQGVVPDENETPTIKEATDGCSRPKRCKAEQACGTDTMSKLAEAVSEAGIIGKAMKDATHCSEGK